jgi:F-type H+-transporting ATPase subunit epsilon
VLVGVPATEGDIGLMYKCAPLMSTIRRGIIRIKHEDDEVTEYAVDGGYIEVDGHKAIILATRAINAKLIDAEVSRDRIARGEKRFEELEENSPARAYASGEISWQRYLLSLTEK